MENLNEKKTKMSAQQNVTFSKRRKGLVQKASHLCTEFGAQIAVIVVSAAGNAFTFGHSSVEHVLRRAAAMTEHFLGDGNALDGERLTTQAREIKDLKSRAKQEESGDITAWIDREIEACESVEQLELLRSNCLALREKIHLKLQNDMSFFPIQGIGFDDQEMGFDVPCLLEGYGFQNDTSVMTEDCYQRASEEEKQKFLMKENWDGNCTTSSSGENDTSFVSIQGIGFDGQEMGFDVPCLLEGYDYQNDTSVMAENWYQGVSEEENREFLSGNDWEGNCATSSSGENGTSFGSVSDDFMFDIVGPISFDAEEMFCLTGVWAD